MTDHLNHSFLATKQSLSGRYARWLDDLAPYDFVIIYRPGLKNRADGLSKRPDHCDLEERKEAFRELLPEFQAKFRTEGIGEVDDTSQYPQISFVRGLGQNSCHIDRGSEVTPTSRYPQSSFVFRCLNSVVTDGNGNHEPQDPTTVPEDLLPSIEEAIREAQQGDAFVRDDLWILRRASRSSRAGSPWAKGPDGLLRYRGRIYIPRYHRIRYELLELYHNHPTAGHLGITKTFKRVSRHYYWDSMPKDIKTLVLECLICQKTKPRHHLPYGELAPLPVPSDPWHEISLDFIVSLPVSRTFNGIECNSILVVVDRLTKYAIFIPTSDGLRTEGLVDLLLHYIFS